jgi:hypothetical protein
VFYTGENQRPNYNNCDFSLSFDFDNYDNRNFRLPLWILYIDWFRKGGYNSPKFILPLEKLSKNNFTQTPKDRFCCLINNHLGNRRDEIVKELSAYKPLGLFGEPWNNAFSGEDKKYWVLSNYKFNICFENNNHPGYFTEKLLHAKSAGCIPIYNGNKEVHKDFNRDCFINLQDFDSIKEFVEYIKEIDNNDHLYVWLRMRPLFKKIPNLEEVKLGIKKLLNI